MISKGLGAQRAKLYMPYKHTKDQRRWVTKNPKQQWAVYARRDARKRAHKKGLPFNLTTVYIRTLMTDKCPIFGTDFRYGQNRGVQPTSPSLDRIRPELGYVVGNVIIISSKANSIKSAYGSKELYMVADWLYKIEKGKND